MALMRSFNRQRGLRKCPICSVMVTLGKYPTHLSECVMESDDDDCMVVETITTEDKKRHAAEQIICLDDSGDESEVRNSAESSSVKSMPPAEIVQSSDSNNNISDETRNATARGNLDRSKNPNGTRSKIGCKNQRRIQNRNETNENRETNPDESGQSSVSNNNQGFERIENRIHGDGTGRTNELFLQEECNSSEATIPDNSVANNLNTGEEGDGGDAESFGRMESSTSVSASEEKRARVNNKKRPTKMNLHYKEEKAKKPKVIKQNEKCKEVKSEISIVIEKTIKKETKTEPGICETKREIKTSKLPVMRKNNARVVASSSPSKGNAGEKLISLTEVARRVRKSLQNCETELSSTAVPESALKKLADDCNGNDENNDANESAVIDNPTETSKSDCDDQHSGAVPPYYLVLFMRVLKRVLYDQCNERSHYSPSFWGENLRIAEKFLSLSDRTKCLFVKLFTRKRRWVLADRLDYGGIATDLVPLFEELNSAGLVESCRSGLNDLSEAIRLLHAPSLKVIGKKFHVDVNVGKLNIIQSLLKMSRMKNVLGMPNAVRMLQIVKENLGPCYRTTENAWRFFNAVFTLYSPSDMSSSNLLDQPNVNLASQLLFVLLQLSLNKIRYPAPSSSPIIPVYEDQEMLFSYVIAKELEAVLAEAMGRSKWEEVESGAQKASECLSKITHEYRIRCEALPPYLRRYTDIWVYTRCMSFGIEAFQRQRKYEEAVVWLQRLLYSKDMKNFVMDARGGWWDRLALNLDSHLNRKREAFEAIRTGLEDAYVGDKDRLLLQDRGEKIDANWTGPLKVPDPERVNISGSILSKNLGDSRSNRFIITRTDAHYECSVEEVALNHFLKDGYKEGVHAEGSVWHTIYGLLCYDIIFDDRLENVWFSETQTNPADLNFRDLYVQRKSAFDQRFALIENSSIKELVGMMKPVYDTHFGETNSEISWEVFSEFAQIERFITCCHPVMLAAVFRRISTDYRNCRSGFPDLTVWNAATNDLAVVEVKGPGDKLSTKQRLWLKYFSDNGVIAQVCHVAARNSKYLDDD